MSNFKIYEANFSRSNGMFSFLLNVPDLSSLAGNPEFSITNLYHYVLIGKVSNPILFCFLYHGNSNYRGRVSHYPVKNDKLFIIDLFDNDSLINNTSILGIPVVVIHEEDVRFDNAILKEKLENYVGNSFDKWTPTDKGYDETLLTSELNRISKSQPILLSEVPIAEYVEPKTVTHGGVLKPGT